MLKNKILIGAMILGVSSVAFAGVDSIPAFKSGFYAGIQGGWGQVDEGSALKDSINHYYDLFPSVFLFSSAFENSTVLIRETKDINDENWITGRLLLGYNFCPYFSVESGYTHFPKKSYDSAFNVSMQILDDVTLNANSFREYRLNTYAVDLVGKIIYPFGHSMDMYSGWNVYAKFGVAYVHTAYSYTAINSELDTEIEPNLWAANSYGERTVVTALRPTYGLGVGYNFNENVGIDLSWMGIYGGQDRFDRVADNFINKNTNSSLLRTRNVTPTTNFIAVGLTYKFVKV